MDNRLAELREKKGMKQAELARQIGLSRGQVANLESGTRTIDLPVLRRCARILGCAVVDLLLPEDAPGYPTADETKILEELRKASHYDARAVLVATRAVIVAAEAVAVVRTIPREMEGDPDTLNAFVRNWNSLDAADQHKAVSLLETAREFKR